MLLGHCLGYFSHRCGKIPGQEEEKLPFGSQVGGLLHHDADIKAPGLEAAAHLASAVGKE